MVREYPIASHVAVVRRTVKEKVPSVETLRRAIMLHEKISLISAPFFLRRSCSSSAGQLRGTGTRIRIDVEIC